MKTCPTHQGAPPPPPSMPHRAGPSGTGYVCKGCGAAAGSPEEQRSHHCPCCGEQFEDGCTGRPPCRTCPHCGTIDTRTGQWLPPTDPLADFLADRYTRSEWFRAWEQASVRFGHDIAHRLAQVTTEIDRAHLYGEIVVGRQKLGIRYGPRGFQAAAPCPRRDECRRGRLWTPVWTRQDLHAVHLHGPGIDATECDRARLHRV
ncbi:hypothetical protein ACWC1C_38150 [Streptomyces sp. NPDC001705]